MIKRVEIADVVQLVLSENPGVVTRELPRLVFRRIRELAGAESRANNLCFDGFPLPYVIEVSRPGKESVYVNVAAATIAEMENSVAQRRKKLKPGQHRVFGLEVAARALRPYVGDDPECTFVEALRKRAEGYTMNRLGHA